MPANRLLLTITTTLTLLLAGCTWNNPSSSARQEEPPEPEPAEPPQVVDDKSEEPPEEPPEITVNGVVQSYVARVDGVNERAHRPQTNNWQAAPQYATDLRPDSTPPDQSIVVIPDEDPTQPANTADQPTARDDDSTNQQPKLQPPRIADVSVRAAPNTPTSTSSDHDTPGINTGAVARHTAPRTLADFLDSLPPPEEGAFRDQLDARIRWVTAGEYERARDPLQLVTAEQQRLATSFIEALIAIREAHMGDLAGAADAAAEPIAQLQNSLRQLSDLSIPKLAICSVVSGYGQYTPIEPARFLTGHTNEFVLYAEVQDFVSELRSNGYYHTVFDMTTTILNRAGDTVLKLEDHKIVDRCRNRRRDCFIPRLVRLPATLSPGRYVAKITIIDKLKRRVAENQIRFEIVAGG